MMPSDISDAVIAPDVPPNCPTMTALAKVPDSKFAPVVKVFPPTISGAVPV